MFQKSCRFFTDRPLVLLFALQVCLALALDGCGPFDSLMLAQGRLDGPMLWGLLVAACLAVVSLHVWQRRFLQGFVLVGLVVLSAGLFFFQQKNLSANIFPKRSQFEAEVALVDTQTATTTRVVVDLKNRIYPAAEAVSGRVMLTIGEACPLQRGSQIVFNANVKEPTGFRNPGGFDYAKYLERKNIWGRAFVETCAEVSVVAVGSPSPRDWIRGRILAPLAGEGVKNGAAMSALVLGTKSLEQEQYDTIRDSGLSHLFAISGSQFGVMSAIFYFLVSLITRLFPHVYLKIPRQKIAALFTAAFVIFYLWIVTPSASITRAGFMIIAYLLSIILERQNQLVHFILLSAAIMLFFWPLEIFGVAFQLSYLCVLILAMVYPRLAKKFEKQIFQKLTWRPFIYLFHVLCVTWLLNILLIPLILFEFGASPLSGLINNLWAVPYFDLVIVPISLFYLLLSLISSALSVWVALGWDYLLMAFFNMVTLVQSLGLPKVQTWTPHAVHILIFYVGLFWMAHKPRRKFLIIWMSVLLVSLGLTFYDLKIRNDLCLTQIDVGQGDATLVQTKTKNILIDTGGHRFFDLGEMVLAPFLRYQWVSRLDAVVVTHADLDHYGALKGLIEAVSIKEIWASSTTLADPVVVAILERAIQKGIVVKEMEMSNEIFIDDKTKFTVLWPSSLANGLDDNAASLVLRLDHEHFSALFTGDVTQASQKMMVEQEERQLKVDVLAIPHHGAKTALDPKFLSVTNPSLALIGVGQRSRYGHPHRVVLDALTQNKVTILRTDLNGATGVRVRHGSIRMFASVPH